MNKALVVILFLVLWSLPGKGHAGDRSPESLRELIVLGLETNLGLKIEQAYIPRAEAAIVIEKAAFDSEFFSAIEFGRLATPYESSSGFSGTSDFEQLSGRAGFQKRFMTGLSGSLSVATDSSSDNDLSNDLDPRYQTSLLLEINQPLLRNLGSAVNSTDLETVKVRKRQAVLAYLQRAQRLILELEISIRQLVGLEKVIRLREQALSLADELYAANSKRYRAGLIPVTEIQEAETAQASRQLQLSVARQNHELQLQELNRQLDYKLSDRFVPTALDDGVITTDEFVLPDFEGLYDSAKNRRLDLKILAATLQEGALRTGYLRNQLLPTLDLTLQAGINGLAGNDRGGFPGSRYPGNWFDSVGSMTSSDGYQWGAGLLFTMPLGNRAARARLQQAEMQIKQDRLQQMDLESAVKKELLQQRVVLERSLEQLRLAERFESLAQQSLAQEQRKLEEGLSDTFRMISFQEKMIAAKIDRLNAWVQYQIAMTQMDYLSGDIFERHGIVLANDSEELNLENI